MSIITKRNVIISVFAVAIIAVSSFFLLNNRNIDMIGGTMVGGGSYPNSKWVNIGSFSGYQTDIDETKLPDGANGRGQNTTTNSGDRISLRKNGLSLFPTGDASTTNEDINTLHTFRKKTGESILMRTRGTVVEYFEETGDAWTILKGGYTNDQNFGFADYNKTNLLESKTYFGNAVEPFSSWTGAHTTLSEDVAVGTTTAHVADADDFDSSGTIVICGAEHAYSARTANTFTIAAATVACATGIGIPEAVAVDASNPKGNIYMAFDNRLLIAGIASSSQAVYFSKYGDPEDYLTPGLISASTDADADIFNLVEGGGAVTGLAMDENALYIFKKSIIYKVSLTDTDYNVSQLKPFDGRSQTTGLAYQGGTFSGGNEIFFVTPDNQIMSIQRVENVDFPQIVPISSAIQNTVDSMNFDSMTGIVYKDQAYFSCKSTVDAQANDTTLIWNIREKTWDSPIIGWNVNDYAVYDDGTGENLYLGESISPNIYKLSEEIIDDTFEVKANWRSKQFDFGMPYSQKSINDLYIQGYIAQNTTLTIKLLLDEDGFTQTFSTDFSGDESDYIFNGNNSNAFGLSPFGAYRFGSYDETTNMKPFRIYLNKNFRPLPFYNTQIDFSSEGLNEKWEITYFGFSVEEYTQPVKRELIRSFQ
jgi:hypothetical protein